MAVRKWTDPLTGKTYAYDFGFDTDETDIKELLKRHFNVKFAKFDDVVGNRNKKTIPDIKKVIFNDPATIVQWVDGTKTVVKCQDNDKFDPEKGLAMAISKKALGNEGNYYNHVKKWVETYPKNDDKFNNMINKIKELNKLMDIFNESFKGTKIVDKIINKSETDEYINVNVEMKGKKI